jgi:DNA-binding XRE family transcriptional regulator
MLLMSVIADIKVHPMNQKVIGKYLKNNRKALVTENTQAEIASKIGVSRQTISEIENGRYTGSLAIFIRYLNFLGLEIEVKEKPFSVPQLDDLADLFGDEE